jgi:hypothetical protein
LPCNPETIIGEVLGQKALKGVNPAATNYQCPFIKRQCVKRSTNLGIEPYPVCTVWKRSDELAIPLQDLICVCPKRFYAVDFSKDVIEHCWPWEQPPNAQIAPEVKMKGFGNVDFVIADVQEDNSIGHFLSVELQAIDITGSAFKAYQALREGIDLPKRPTYGLNWDNVYKRYITQLIRKGYFHHHWKSKIVAVIQDQIYQNITSRADFMRSDKIKDPNINIIFMTYRFEDDPSRPGQYRPVLTTVEGTSHANLQNAFLYKEASSRDTFSIQIQRSLSRVLSLKDLIGKT